MTANADQIEFWNGRGGQKWAEQQAATDRMLDKIGKAALAFVAAKSGEHVVDIGCGTGTTTFALADSVGAAGQVTGVDISKPMLGLARERTGARKNVAFVEADASVFPFTTTIDLIFSRFGVMFFDAPAKAFENIHRALKPTGRIAFVCWRTPQENAWAADPIAAARPFLPPPSQPADPLAPGPFAFADPDRIKLILTEAGFRAVNVEPLNTTTNLGPDIETAAQQTLEIGPLSRAIADAKADDATRAKIVAAVKTALEKYKTPEGVTPPAACWLVSAKN